MIDSTSIQLRESLRADLAARMASFELQHGPVETQPIRFDGKVKVEFVISSPDKPKTEGRAARQHRLLAEKRGVMNTARQRKGEQRLETIKSMAALGARIHEMAAATGITPGSVMRYIRDHQIERGPKMNLEASDEAPQAE